MKHLEWRKFREENSKRLECHAIFAYITMISGRGMIPGIDILDVNLRSKLAEERVEFCSTILFNYSFHTIKFILLKCTVQWFSGFLAVQSSPLSNSRTFSPPERKSCTH